MYNGWVNTNDMTHKEFIPYQESLELKELGFDEECLAWHNGVRLFIDNYNAINSKMYFDYCCSIPLYQQVFRWFREKYQLYAWVKIEYEYGGITPTYYITGKRQDDIPGGPFNTYEEAELACLKKLIDLLKGK